MLRISEDSRCTHGFDVLVAWQLRRCLSTGSSAASAQRYGLGSSSSHLQRVSFAIRPFRGWRCAEASSFKHHALEQRTTPNSPDEINRCMFCSRLVPT